nr:unnamed protein product [Spirometra erinaceieuropaei]
MTAELQHLRRVPKANGYPRNLVSRRMRERDETHNSTGLTFWRALQYVKKVSEAVNRLLIPFGIKVAHRPKATTSHDAEIFPATAGHIPGRLPDLVQLRTTQLSRRNWKITSDAKGRTCGAASVLRKDASYQIATHSTGPDQTPKFDKREITARGDNRVRREPLLESWFAGPHVLNKRNDLPLLYSVLRFYLVKVISHARRVRAANSSSENEPNWRMIVTPKINNGGEITATEDALSDRHAIIASNTAPEMSATAVNYCGYAVTGQLRPTKAAPLVPPLTFSANVSVDGFA